MNTTLFPDRKILICEVTSCFNCPLYRLVDHISYCAADSNVKPTEHHVPILCPLHTGDIKIKLK